MKAGCSTETSPVASSTLIELAVSFPSLITSLGGICS